MPTPRCRSTAGPSAHKPQRSVASLAWLDGEAIPLIHNWECKKLSPPPISGLPQVKGNTEKHRELKQGLAAGSGGLGISFWLPDNHALHLRHPCSIYYTSDAHFAYHSMHRVHTVRQMHDNLKGFNPMIVNTNVARPSCTRHTLYTWTLRMQTTLIIVYMHVRALCRESVTGHNMI